MSGGVSDFWKVFVMLSCPPSVVSQTHVFLENLSSCPEKSLAVFLLPV